VQGVVAILGVQADLDVVVFSAEFFEKAKDVTFVHFSQMVELRRKSARELHMLAGLAGETIISNEMTKKVSEMIRVFIERAKERLEK